MTNTLSSAVEMIKEIVKHPAMYGTEEAAHGMILGLAAAIISINNSSSLQKSLPIAFDILDESTSEIPHSRHQGVLLCDESRFPKVITSFDALTRNGEQFLNNLLTYIEADK